MKIELREDGKYEAGMVVSAWFHWNKNYRGNSYIEWIDNNKYVLNKNDLITNKLF
jgi:hypothetical protein